MAIYALADLHLAFGAPEKTMEFFGPSWHRYAERMEEAWRTDISNEDLVLLPGDISWAMTPEQAEKDLLWIDALPGTKVMIRGNHDYWWSSLAKIQKVLPPSIHLIQNNAFYWKEYAIAGARLWDTTEYSFNPFIEFKENPKQKAMDRKEAPEESEKIFLRELQRLEMSLKEINPNALKKIAMTHYPPIGADLQPSRASALLEKYKVDCCVFGHLHNVRDESLPFGIKDGVRYLLTSADYLNFKPLKLFE